MAKKTTQEKIEVLQEQIDELRASEKKATHAILVLDRSGSMNSCRQATEDGVNEYLGSLKADTENSFVVSLLEFDSDSMGGVTISWVYECLALAKVPEYKNFNPRGGTPLYDAIGRAVEFAGTVETTYNTVVVILTDGGENASRSFSQAQIKEMLESKQNNHDWTVIYVGANQDAWAVGGGMGVNQNTTYNFNTNSMGSNFSSLGASVSASSTAYAMNSTPVERTAAIKATRLRTYVEEEKTPDLTKDSSS